MDPERGDDEAGQRDRSMARCRFRLDQLELPVDALEGVADRERRRLEVDVEPRQTEDLGRSPAPMATI